MRRGDGLGRLVLALLASTAIPSAGVAQQRSGETVRVAPDANASGAGGARLLQAPGDIFQGDEITTDPNGEVQIRFVDNTRFVVGPNSRVVIDEFVFKPDGTAEDLAIGALKGTFRFISGTSPKEAYAVRTPTMTIGVRGSAFNLAVLGNSQSILEWLEDEGTVCVAPAGSPPGSPPTLCQDVTAGDVVGASPGGGFSQMRPGERGHLTGQLFRDIGARTGLPPEFRTDQPNAGRPGSQGNAPESGGQKGEPPSPPSGPSSPPSPPPASPPPSPPSPYH